VLHSTPLAGLPDKVLIGMEFPLGPVADAAALLEVLTGIGVSAALEILRLRSTGDVRIKADGSPVTAADEAAEAVIRDGLRRSVPHLPVVSEEQAEQPPITGKNLILVDPLDGTRDFVAGRDEYTVNIALLRDGVPALGVIAAPALGQVWRGILGLGAERLEFGRDGTLAAPAAIRARDHAAGDLTVMVSRSHLDARTTAYVEALPRAKLVRCGSAVKFCRVAEGTADLYPRLAPTRDWDVAAGHAILMAAGGSVVAPDGRAIVYGTPERLIPGFLASADPAGAAASKG
jgi:3'(2'), 5'-bisphosphate nucleotidase